MSDEKRGRQLLWKVGKYTIGDRLRFEKFQKGKSLKNCNFKPIFRIPGKFWILSEDNTKCEISEGFPLRFPGAPPPLFLFSTFTPLEILRFWRYPTVNHCGLHLNDNYIFLYRKNCSLEFYIGWIPNLEDYAVDKIAAFTSSIFPDGDDLIS